jgi:hypothetical protein
MKLLDKYMQEIGNNLPSRKQADLTAEIRSLIEDTLDDRSQAAGRPVDEEMVAEVLKEFGPPEKVAASYLPERYLVGPQLFPIYALVLRIVLTVVAVVALVGIGVNIAQQELTLDTFGKALFEGFAGLMSAGFQTLGTITFIFAIIQWAQPQIRAKNKAWDPHQMKDTYPTDLVRPAEQIVQIVLTSIVLLLFNFYPDAIGFYSMVDGQWVHVPILSQEFFRYLPWLNAVWGLSILLNLLLLNRGSWTTGTRWLSVGISVLTIVIMTTMIFGPDLLVIDSDAVATLGWTVGDAQDLELVFNALVRFILGIILISELMDLARTLWRILGKGRDLPFTSPI